MRCPMCDHSKSIVLETRSSDNEYTFRRRRKCVSCSHGFSTIEHIIDDLSIVISKDGHRTPFSRKQLADSLMLAGKDSLTEADRETITEEIMSELSQRGPTVTTSEIALVALGFLVRADLQSWLRYALKVIDVKTVPEYVKWVNTNSEITGERDKKEPRILVRKKDGTIEYFNSSKLIRSIQHASQGRISDQSLITDIINRISTQARTVFHHSGNPISTLDIGDWVESSLVSLDPLIALSYSILFRSVDSLSSLEKVAQKIETLSEIKQCHELDEGFDNHE